MPMPRHAWWRGTGLTWRGPAWGADDVAGLAAPPTLARQCRALLRGVAGPKYRTSSHTTWPLRLSPARTTWMVESKRVAPVFC